MNTAHAGWLLIVFFLVTTTVFSEESTVSLTLIKDGAGEGVVTPEANWYPGRRHLLQRDTTLTLRAQPDRNSTFVQWKGDLPDGSSSSENPLLVTVRQDATVWAVFDRPVVSLAIFRHGPENAGTTLPPPGIYSFRKGDAVLTQAVPATPATAVEWSGAVSGNASAVLVELDTDKEVTADFQDIASASPAASPELFPLEVSDSAYPAFHACLAGGDLFCWFCAVHSNDGAWGAGIRRISHRNYPLSPFVENIALNFEHIMNGAAQDVWRSQYTPRHDPMFVDVTSPASASVSWKAGQSSWGLDCRMDYVLPGGPCVDLAVSITPRKVEAPQGYLALMWASYFTNAMSRAIHFPGEGPEGSCWVAFGEDAPNGEFDTGTVSYEGTPNLPYETGSDCFNIIETPGIHFSKPYYYGLLGIDGYSASDAVPMMFAMMFDNGTPFRFALWNWGKNPRFPAWDWQYIITDPQVDATYRYNARMLLTPFEDTGRFAGYYDEWRGAAPAPPAVPDPALCRLIPPNAPMYDPIGLARQCVEKGFKNQGMRLLLDALSYRTISHAAANVLDELFTDGKPLDFWHEIVRQRPELPDVQVHLALALFDSKQFAEAWSVSERGLTLNAADAFAWALRGASAAALGDMGAAMECFDKSVSLDPSKGPDANKFFLDAGRSLLETKQWNAAIALFQNERLFSPGELWRRIYLGEALAGVGRYDDALAEYKTVLDVYPDATHTGDLAEAALIARQDRKGRVAYWRVLAEKHPSNAEPARRLALARDAENGR